MIGRDIELSGETGARLHIAHASTAEGISMVRKAKKKGLNVTCEVTPHHLLLTEKDVCGNPNMKMNPPLRTEADRDALIDGINDGTVDAIATDHAPHAMREKADFATAPFGVIGMETALPSLMRLVEKKQMSLDRLIKLLTVGPARVAGLSAGTLSVGRPADIAIFDISKEYTIDSSQFKSKSRNTPFDGWHVRGRVVYTIVRGKAYGQTA